ncbi:GNAT family N-acetyltransferase [Ferrimonas lipolytica]|uniref:GNAT family N-acetyltransferase n=1 Tax=Ferrimonas lipolytica TaxID=2724191 RepID=A0A6H1UBX6_9GAMM|nr:GNAT family N-acetyltransferase [Ferrimonas lipolytica]QIZ76338.1 GNAT family N-acetyltransferase [Ferrimonas lipolytica]
MSFRLRPITSSDDPTVATIIRSVLTEFGANQPGFAWQDPELECLSKVYGSDNSRYLVVEQGTQVLGGAGVAPFRCHLDGVCELQKMYLSQSARGLGAGRLLLVRLLQFAKEQGYQYCYLETYGPMTQAQQLYRSLGFREQPEPWGNSGHSACDRWFVAKL